MEKNTAVKGSHCHRKKIEPKREKTGKKSKEKSIPRARPHYRDRNRRGLGKTSVAGYKKNGKNRERDKRVEIKSPLLGDQNVGKKKNHLPTPIGRRRKGDRTSENRNRKRKKWEGTKHYH